MTDLSEERIRELMREEIAKHEKEKFVLYLKSMKTINKLLPLSIKANSK